MTNVHLQTILSRRQKSVVIRLQKPGTKKSRLGDLVEFFLDKQ